LAWPLLENTPFERYTLIRSGSLIQLQAATRNASGDHEPTHDLEICRDLPLACALGHKACRDNRSVLYQATTTFDLTRRSLRVATCRLRMLRATRLRTLPPEGAPMSNVSGHGAMIMGDGEGVKTPMTHRGLANGRNRRDSAINPRSVERMLLAEKEPLVAPLAPRHRSRLRERNQPSRGSFRLNDREPPQHVFKHPRNVIVVVVVRKATAEGN
jgi:hypothetical protein